MKVGHFAAPRVLVGTLAQTRAIVRGCVSIFLRNKAVAMGVVVAGFAMAFLIWPLDLSWLDALHIWHGGPEAFAHNLAWLLGTFGDYPTYNLPFALLIWFYGVVTRRSAWRRIAVVVFLGSSLAGLFDDFFRLTLGRPRPDTLSHTNLKDGFYGPLYALRGGFQSFPSGHAASTFGAAAALVMTEWRLGVLATVVACGVCWARLELYRHYPSDVAVGIVIGLYFGLLVGFAARNPRILAS